MVAKLFTKPFGVAGDKTPIPNDTQVDGTVSYQTGFGADYERQLGVDPAAKNIGRQTFNELMFDVTASLQEMQAGFGTSPFSASLAAVLPGGGYPKGAFIPRLAGTGFWVSLVAANSTDPDAASDPAAAGWAPISLPGRFYAVDTGAVNAYSCTFSPALTAPRLESQPLTIKIANTNTGASTLFDGIATRPILGEANLPLEGGELIAGGYAWLQWSAGLAAYILLFCNGGASQVTAATRKSQTITAGQLIGQNLVAFTTTGTAGALILTPIPAATAYTANLRYTVTFNAASTGTDTLNVSGLGVKSLKQYDPTGAKVAAIFAVSQISDVIYDGTDLILLDQLQGATQATETVAGVIRKATSPEAIAGASDAGAMTPLKTKAALDARLDAGCYSGNSGLRITTTGLTGVAVLSAATMFVNSPTGRGAYVPVSVTISLTNSGLYGLDTGSPAANTWYYVWAIYNGTTTAAIFSLSSSSPTLPSTYTMAGRMGAVRTGSSASVLLSTIQVGSTVRYKVAAGTNTAALPLMINGIQGNPAGTTPTLIATAISSVVPPTAVKIGLSLAGYCANTSAIAAPNNAYIGIPAGATQASPLSISQGSASSTQLSATGDFVIESTNVYYASSASPSGLSCTGWEDSI